MNYLHKHKPDQNHSNNIAAALIGLFQHNHNRLVAIRLTSSLNFEWVTDQAYPDYWNHCCKYISKEDHPRLLHNLVVDAIRFVAGHVVNWVKLFEKIAVLGSSF
ncbi:hypothetical protein [Acinetobacter sp. ANC 3791]|uniref:hypothetical protein n=1 Tax=Acinetobacter sp. ANC 3791 TaxID=2529836 RepID=UPI00103B8A19|nr:hypothetical protein [Acinetobacter sp. ANC 3791]TCB84733.1 hypothetical protein E0H90_06030 [Acinetobacter sp. ANC 3791]